MNLRVVQGIGCGGERYELFLATVNPEEGEYSRGSVSHTVGGASVTIVGNSPDCGATYIDGRENLRLLRDALNEICRMEGIE